MTPVATLRGLLESCPSPAVRKKGLLCLELPWGGGWPAPPAAASPPPWLWWRDPLGQSALVALGSAAQWVPDGGREPLARMPGLWRTAREGIQHHAPLSDGVGPVMVTGFAFDPGHPPEPGDPWKAFPPALLRLPRVLLLGKASAPQGGVAQFCAPLDDTPWEAMLHRWSRELEVLEGHTGPRPARQQRIPGPPPPTRERLAAWLTPFLQRVEGGDLQKIVPVWRWQRTGQFDPAPALERLLRESGGGVVWAERTDRWLLAVPPERLVMVDREGIQVEAVAGTWRRGETPPLHPGSLLMREHDPVVAHLRRCLHTTGLEVVVTGPPFQERQVGELVHLVTSLHARGPHPPGVLELAARLHPTPAVCGEPPLPARAALTEGGEPCRGWFAGATGWLDARGHGSLSTTLRAALVHDRGAELHAGAGLVAGAQRDREAREIGLKLSLMTHILDGAEP